MTAHELNALKVGDRVWVGNSLSPKHKVSTVIRLTKTLIILDKEKNYYSRYHRHDGVAVSGGMFRDRITSKATAKQVKEYDDEQQRKDNERRAWETEQERRKKLATELSLLFGSRPNSVHVDKDRDDDTPSKDTVTVSFYDLSVEQVRRLAELVKEL